MHLRHAPLLLTLLPALLLSDDEPVFPDMPEGRPPRTVVEDAEAREESAMKAYTEIVPGCTAALEMIAIRSGRYQMGSPPGEAQRKSGEGPLHEVALDAFWMSKYEVSWDLYQVFMYRRDVELRKEGHAETAPQDPWADAVSRPTPPYVPMDFGMGIEGYPAVCMTQFAARQFTKWLSMKTGRFYRLPTEAEWEYACRAGTTTAYSFGDDPAQLDQYAWYFDNADDKYQPIGKKKPNPWGLYDMHGNVAEWVLDRYDKEFYRRTAKQVSDNPIAWPTKLYPRIVRGGSWDDDPDRLRSAARRKSTKGWKVQDPQLPKSIWYHTDASFVGVRLVRPLVEPTDEERERYWKADMPEVLEIQERQRHGAR